MADAVPVAVIGCGRMGRLHARVYSQMPTVNLVGVFDANPEAAAETAEQYKTVAFPSIDELLPHVRAVTIAVPTTYHLPTATPFLERGVSCLIEKPLAKNSTEANQIVALAARFKAMVQVGHIERFNPAVRAMLELDLVPGFMEVTRISPLSFRSIDVGVVLDMMIHDIDIVLQLARSPIKSIDAVGVNVIGDTEDICNVRLRFVNGCVADITASRLSMKTERKLRVFGHEQYVSIDYQKRYGIAIRKAKSVQNIRDVLAQIRSGEIEDLSDINYTELVDVQELKIDDEEPLRAELDAFIAAHVNGTKPVVTADDGLAAVDVAEQIVAAMTKSQVN
ncbi:MAG: Gfo/Idh/MocA family oxidoreductase [Burkholderiales bacterium]|nr:Gfo/Idh/MocA family oxidoreductase [Phycisphaerae bacterium]